MTISMTIIFITFIYCVLVSIVYFKKDKINSEETKIYSYLIGLSLLNLINEFALCVNILLKIPMYSFFNLLLNRLFLILLFSWYMLFTYYILSLIYKNTKSIKGEQIFNLIKKIFPFFIGFICILILILPITLINENGYAYSTGIAVNFTFGINIAVYVLLTIIIIKHYKNIPYRKMVPFIALMACLAAFILCRFINPGILLNSFSVAFPTILMYFTIENPDLKMIEELTNARKLSEKANDEKSEFLYSVSKEVNNTLDGIEQISSLMNDEKDLKKIRELNYQLKEYIINARTKARNTIDVSQIDSQLLRPINNKYNVELLIKQIYLQFKDKINSQIDYRLNIANNIPNELYGDSLRVKQIIATLLDNSIKYTENGFIELSTIAIIKYDVCRLIITVEDSGCGININKQNEILSNHGELSEEELKSKDQLVLNLNTIRKMVNIIGGTVTIESEEGKGTSIKVVLDQKIVEAKKTNEEKQIDEYSDNLKNIKAVAVISSFEDLKHLIKKQTKKLNINYLEFFETKECLDKIRSGVKYLYVFIDENMDKIDAREFISKLKNEQLLTKVIVLTKNKDIRNKKELIDLGASSVLTIPFTKEELQTLLQINA